jgi:hypothetical protein
VGIHRHGVNNKSHHVILFAHYSDSISSKSNHLPSSPTSITRAPPSKDVGRVRKRSSTPLKQHGRRPRLPLPSALPRHSTSSVENTSPGLLPPSSLPRHLTLSVEDASPACHCPRPQVSLAPPQCPSNNPDAVQPPTFSPSTSPTSITRAPPSKDVGRVGKRQHIIAHSRPVVKDQPPCRQPNAGDRDQR